MPPKKILLVDQHQVFRKGLISVLLEDQKLSFEIDETSEIDAKVDIRGQSYDAIILDLFFPEKIGFDLVKDIKKYYSLPILTMSLYSNETFGVRAYKAGAQGFFNKTQPMEEILEALHEILKGNEHFSSRITNKIKGTTRLAKLEASLDTLTNRELQILCLFALGLQTTEIAKKLFVSLATISTHKRNILKKTQITHDSELLRFALKHGLGLKIVDG
jgi:two-component system response regulator NreC